VRLPACTSLLADGTPFWNSLFVGALRGVGGRIVNYVGVQCEVKPKVASRLVAMQQGTLHRAAVAGPLGGVGSNPQGGVSAAAARMQIGGGSSEDAAAAASYPVSSSSSSAAAAASSFSSDFSARAAAAFGWAGLGDGNDGEDDGLPPAAGAGGGSGFGSSGVSVAAASGLSAPGGAGIDEDL